ncbi:YchJ family metal-binding protein [Solidesulfovibrio sp.]|uniref:YchJ family protein n=1 Tax=Solidesulfovibrio sp. TaxID=2910990 RepID=UPI0026343EA6|nr:YchJ family metal-binding protein [Solidesulfovibrio sp.]
MTDEACACGSGRPYAACCGPYLDRGLAAPMAEALMRSRYTAYARGDFAYLKRTLWPRRRDAFDLVAARAFCADVVWKGLTVLAATDGGPDDETGVVAFVAAYEKAGEPQELHEVSRFRKKAGCWYYVDGAPGGGATEEGGQESPPPGPGTRAKAAGRNSPCPCGSGRKYKRCCGA